MVTDLKQKDSAKSSLLSFLLSTPVFPTHMHWKGIMGYHSLLGKRQVDIKARKALGSG